MPRGIATESSETRFWLRTVAVGGWVTLLMCLAGGIYVAGFARPGTQLELGALVALAAVLGGGTLWLVPWRTVIASPWREAVMLTWSALMIGTIATMAALDGGAGSPLALALLLPAVFASLAYELRRVVLIGVLAELAYLMLTLVGSPNAGYVVVFCSVLGGTIVMAVGQAGFHQEWRLQLARSSRTDPLTGLLNRRGLAIASAGCFHELHRRGEPLTLLLLDLDLFKSYNDTHGHRAGDELLRWVANQLSAAVRPGDSVARLGGDEFAVLLPGADGDDAEPLIKRLRESLGRRIPCCVGYATAPEDGTSFDDLYRVGDAALYGHKLGRNGRPFAAEAILAASSDAYFVLDEQCRFAYANPAGGRLLGRDAHDLLGRSVELVCPEAIGSTFEQACRRAFAEGRGERFVQSEGSLEAAFSVRVDPVPGGVSIRLSRIAEEIEEAELDLAASAETAAAQPQPIDFSVTALPR